MADLIIVNLYGGILPENGDHIIRDGFYNFLDRYASSQMAISSYEHRDRVESDLSDVKLIDRIARVYALEDMKYFPAEDIHLPNILTWARRHFNTHETRTVYISNDPRDMEGARWDRAKAIQIPTFKSEEDDFSFDKIKVDSLGAELIDFYQRLRGKPQRIVLE
jgi:hypothetical protein|tara:strand:- start:2819 stop:3310 length:492 start_codon:yes stop_codon:yes gene_type:complete